jgi:ribonuclease HII
MSRRAFFSILQKYLDDNQESGQYPIIEQLTGCEELGDFFNVERKKHGAMKVYEEKARKKGLTTVAGVDEVGRGPLAGPLVAAAVVFDRIPFLPCVDDSKKLTGRERELLSWFIRRISLAYAIGIVEPEEIDRMNVHNASLEAMRRAIRQLSIPPRCILVDGLFSIPSVNITQKAIVKGDQQSFTIACASIIAKVARDRMMDEYEVRYPQYGFGKHKGYPTKRHIDALTKYGCTPIHRKSYAPVKQILSPVYEQLSL